ncbi:MAG: HAMP domain-containing histidine kinase [Acholeplasmataceae bacterium]|nr:HAMP domain-containing histidine kinase [Acholeplasmataceae bacterium]
MSNIRLTTQLAVVFTIVTVLSSLVFIFALNHVFDNLREEQNIDQLAAYYQKVIEGGGTHTESPYNGYVIHDHSGTRSYNLSLLGETMTATEIVNDFSIWPGTTRTRVIDGETYYFMISRSQQRLIVVFTGETYLRDVGQSLSVIVQISFVAIVLLGNVIIWIWSRLTVERVNRLESAVAKLSSSNYHMPIEIEGGDEITELARAIEHMRQEIESNEKNKQNMLQNISHDFKTPIAVIQSYAEAIADGVSDISEADVIIRQADILNQKVKQLLELSKLEYLKDQNVFETVRIKEIIVNIVNNHKYRNNITFVLDLDDSTYFAIPENLYSAFNNIIDNALRYATSTIEITLKNKKLTFYNDGEPISQSFIEQLFKPYEKGDKGQFGLGMSIVQRTVSLFNLTIKVENIRDGVMFTIEPL